jgi:outer membrane biosynthesis protein TonB
MNLSNNFLKLISLFSLTAVMSACVVTQPAPSNNTTPTEAKTEPAKVSETPKEREDDEDKPENPNAWTAEQKKTEVDSCIASANDSLKASGKTAEASKVSSYCNCVIDKAEAKYSYEESNRNASKVIQELTESGVIEACLESAGLKE